MGYGHYSYEAHRDLVSHRQHQSRAEVFRQRATHPLMSPRGVEARESRDSLDHPQSLPIIFALDVTGSMGHIPEQLAKRELPGFMQQLLDLGVEDPQVMFMALGDAFCDRGPLQVGQFESTAEDIDRWLTWSWLEGGGGGNDGESYDLAMYFAARHTVTDAWLKRRKKGYFFMTGDEPPFLETSRSVVAKVIGDNLNADLTLTEVSEELCQRYHPFFLIPDPGRRQRCEAQWRPVFGDHVIALEDSADTCLAAAILVGLQEGRLEHLDEAARRLRQQGLTGARVAGLVRALTPFACTLGRDGNAPPYLEPVALP